MVKAFAPKSKIIALGCWSPALSRVSKAGVRLAV